MKISERVALIKAGYNREEIAAMIEEERNQPPIQALSPPLESVPPIPDEEVIDPAPTPQVEPMFPAWASALLAKVDSLQETIQATNLQSIEQPEQMTTIEAATDALLTAYGGAK